LKGGLLVYRTIVKENWLVSLGDERDCVAVPDWKVKEFSGVCAAAAGCVMGRNTPVPFTMLGVRRLELSRMSCVLVAVLVLDVVSWLGWWS